jgi:hypothetical protein
VIVIAIQASYASMIELVLKAIETVLKTIGFRDERRFERVIDRKLIQMLSDPRFEKRSFKELNRKIGGFDGDPDALRRHLTGLGAERFGKVGPEELWALPNADRSVSSRGSGRTVSFFLAVLATLLILLGVFYYDAIFCYFSADGLC